MPEIPHSVSFDTDQAVLSFDLIAQTPTFTYDDTTETVMLSGRPDPVTIPVATGKDSIRISRNFISRIVEHYSPAPPEAFAWRVVYRRRPNGTVNVKWQIPNTPDPLVLLDASFDPTTNEVTFEPRVAMTVPFGALVGLIGVSEDMYGIIAGGWWPLRTRSIP